MMRNLGLRAYAASDLEEGILAILTITVEYMYMRRVDYKGSLRYTLQAAELASTNQMNLQKVPPIIYIYILYIIYVYIYIMQAIIIKSKSHRKIFWAECSSSSGRVYSCQQT